MRPTRMSVVDMGSRSAGEAPAPRRGALASLEAARVRWVLGEVASRGPALSIPVLALAGVAFGPCIASRSLAVAHVSMLRVVLVPPKALAPLSSKVVARALRGPGLLTSVLGVTLGMERADSWLWPSRGLASLVLASIPPYIFLF